MSEKIYFFIIVLVFLGQIAFSFFYSSQMVSQNTQLNQSVQQLKILKQENQELLQTSSQLYSINHIYSKISTSSAQAINNYINLGE